MVDMPKFNRPIPDAIDFLESRRSGSAKAMKAPGPDASQLRRILGAGARVPDHGKLAPWRFIVIEGVAREKLGAVLAERVLALEPGASDVRLEIERNRFMRAPVIVAVVSHVVKDAPIPEWEQVLSSGAVCMTMLIAATSLGFVGNWITEWCAYDAVVTERLGLKDNERIAGFLYFGSPAAPLEERVRPDLDPLITKL